MKEKKTLSVPAKLRLVEIIAIILLIISCAVFSMYMTMDTYPWFVLLMLAIVYLNRKIRAGIVARPLITDRDPERYRDAIPPVKRTTVFEAEAAYYCGDYQRVVDVCTAGLSEENMPEKSKKYLAVFLMRTYLETDECDKLTEVLSQWDSLNAKGRKIPSTFADYCRKYAAGDYEGALAVKRELPKLSVLLSKKRVATIELHVKFTTALALYRLGRGEEARPLFDEVAKAAPKFGYAKLSAKYIGAIDSGETVQAVKTSPTDESSEAAAKLKEIVSKDAKRAQLMGSVSKALIILFLCLLVVWILFDSGIIKINTDIFKGQEIVWQNQ